MSLMYLIHRSHLINISQVIVKLIVAERGIIISSNDLEMFLVSAIDNNHQEK